MNDFKHMYMCEWNSKIETEELTLDEAVDRYNIDRESIGWDRGVCFSKIAMRINNNGEYRVVSYLPRNATSYKKFDFYISIKIEDENGRTK